MSKSISSREAGQSRRRRKENKAVVLCESLRLGPALRDEIVYFFTASCAVAKQDARLISSQPALVLPTGTVFGEGDPLTAWEFSEVPMLAHCPESRSPHSLRGAKYSRIPQREIALRRLGPLEVLTLKRRC